MKPNWKLTQATTEYIRRNGEEDRFICNSQMPLQGKNEIDNLISCP
jgi:hypothetical protein